MSIKIQKKEKNQLKSQKKDNFQVKSQKKSKITIKFTILKKNSKFPSQKFKKKYKLQVSILTPKLTGNRKFNKEKSTQ